MTDEVLSNDQLKQLAESNRDDVVVEYAAKGNWRVYEIGADGAKNYRGTVWYG